MHYVFSDCELDTQLHLLWRAGRASRLRPKAFEVLTYLVERGDKVVSARELREAVWPGQWVSNAELEHTIQELRRVLGDGEEDQRFIETSHDDGYRFVASITASAAPIPASPEAPLEPLPLSQMTDQRCSHCGTVSRAQAKFCAECGTSLGAGASSDASQTHPQRIPRTELTGLANAPSPTSDTHEPELRQLTVMFCDLAGSTALSVQLDLDDYRDVLKAYQSACDEVIQRFDGYIAQYLGDGILVYFSYPQAHEDDAQRAVHAGLGMIETLRPLNARLQQDHGVRLVVRIGIHTGRVIVSEMGRDRHEPLALGETPNIAARIQALAPPDTVVMSQDTVRLVHGYFDYQELDLYEMKGLSNPMPLFQVLRATGVRNRLDVAGVGGLTPLVGRQSELTSLLEHWSQVKEGSGHLVLLTGEPGIGKSRLVRSLQTHLAEESFIALQCQGSPYHQNSGFYPLIDLWHRVLRWQAHDTPRAKRRKLKTILAQFDLPLEDTSILLADFLSLPPEEVDHRLRHLSPQQQKQRLMELLLAMVRQLAARRPVMLTVEDIHWFDPSTVDALTQLLDHLSAMRLYVVCTSRPTGSIPWDMHPDLTRMTLTRLPRPQVQQMVLPLTRGKPLPEEILAEIVDKADGIPLFVEEITKAILETAPLRETTTGYELTASLSTVAIPSTLHDTLMARLDRLGPAKPLAQLSATIGRRFPYTLLRAVSRQDDTRLQSELQRLVQAELLYQQGVLPQATYVFKHSLIQETAYQSLAKSTRQQYHRDIAQTLVEHVPELGEPQPELLAHHCTEAGLLEQALPYWLQAGRRAIERSANVEAISHLTKGLEVLKTLPITPEHRQQELTFYLALGPPLSMIKGHTAPEVEQVYTQAQALCQQVGDTQQRFNSLVGLWIFALNRAKLRMAYELAQECCTLAQYLEDTERMKEANALFGTTLFYLGDFVLARERLEQLRASYIAHERRGRMFNRARDPQVLGLVHGSVTLWMLGYPEQALAMSQEALALAQKLAYTYDMGSALHFASLLHHYRREASVVYEFAEAAETLSREQGFVRWLGGSLFWRGWALSERGEAEAGILLIRQGIEMWHTMGGELGLPRIYAMLAEACLQTGEIETGLRVLAEALEIARRNAEHRDEAELYRLTGELLLRSGEPPGAPAQAHLVSQAEETFRQAIALAQQRQAKSFELRAVMSLSRLWQQQGKRAEAHRELQRIYSWFTEGFNTPDLRMAKSLLEALQ
jgi:class 3 adenylate cyclase/DNA-binding winged helix-turn-helix (wHTH) protein/predicted ATPase